MKFPSSLSRVHRWRSAAAAVCLLGVLGLAHATDFDYPELQYRARQLAGRP